MLLTDNVRPESIRSFYAEERLHTYAAYLVGFHSHFLVVGGGGFLSRLFLALRPSAEEDVVDQGVLQQCQKHEHKAAHQVHVYGFDVGDLGKGLPQVGVDCGHGQYSRDSWKAVVTMVRHGSVILRH